VAAVRSALDRADKARSDRDKQAAADQLSALEAQLEAAAAPAGGADTARLLALASTLKGIERAFR
jgi:hypothetical protein